MPRTVARLQTPRPETKSAAMQAFGRWLRTGLWPIEVKFNPNHDPANGRFTFGAGGVGALSAKYETRAKGDPGAVSSGRNDPGGVSYGSHQLSTKKRTIDEFVASPEARRWAAAFHGLTPGSPAFSARWRQIAAAEPEAFEAAQQAFTDRTFYDHAARIVRSNNGYDPTGASQAVQEVVYSTAVQHGAAGGARIVDEAIRRADGSGPRGSIGWETVLIHAIYDGRTVAVKKQAANLRALGKFKDANEVEGIAKNRFPAELADALHLLVGR